MVLLCSQASHCLADLLYRWHSGDLHCEIPAVISNHEKLRSMVEWHNIPFHHVPVTPEKKPDQCRNRVTDQVLRADLVVLARYMQIIPLTLPSLCGQDDQYSP